MAEELVRHSLSEMEAHQEEASSFVENLKNEFLDESCSFFDFSEGRKEKHQALEEGTPKKGLSYETSLSQKCVKSQREAIDVPPFPPNKSQFVVFVSFSLKDKALKDLSESMRPLGGRLVLRGLFNNSFKATQGKLMDLGIEADIDPPLFETYHIQKVPTYVLVGENGKTVDQVAGNIFPKAALEIFKEKGDLSSLAASLLEKWIKRGGGL